MARLLGLFLATALWLAFWACVGAFHLFRRIWRRA